MVAMFKTYVAETLEGSLRRRVDESCESIIIYAVLWANDGELHPFDAGAAF